uniref:GG18321 n=2 Tax=Drosophila erecta TaxID=7220 RepID=B3P4H7_DROER
MLALAVIVTQARFIAKRETTGLEQAMASTSIDPDMVKAPRESGSGREPVEINAESDMFSSQTNIEDEKNAETVDPTETQTASLKENPSVKETTVAFEQNESSTTTEKMISEEQLKLKESETTETQLKAAQVDTATTSQLDQTNLKVKESTEAPLKEEPLLKEILNTTTEHIWLTEKVHQKDVTNPPLREAQAEKKDKIAESVASHNSTLPLKPVSVSFEVPNTTERVVNTTTTRSSDHGRSMQYSSTTEGLSRSPAAVTPMKLRPLPMTSTPASTTSTSTPAPTTPVSFASHENVIEESTSKSEVRQLPEKRAKFISENSTNAQQLTLPNTAEVWSLAGMKAVPKAPLTTTTIVPLLKHTDLANDIDMHLNKTELHKEKNLLDWMNIAMLPLTPENRTEFVVRTTLDATEGATQATTEALAEESHLKNDLTVGLEQDSVTTARTMASTPDPGSMDLNTTTTTVRTQQLEVPMVKKMADVANAKLTEAITEAQRETDVGTEAATSVTLPEQLATSAVTARVDSPRTELLNITAAAAESGEISMANSTDTLSAMTSTTTTTERPISVEQVTAEQDLEVATSQAPTTAATSSGTTEAAATSSTTAATLVVSEAATAAEASATTEATTAATSSVAATPSTTEVAMKATEISNISDDHDDGDNSNDVIVATTKFPESEQAATTTTARVEPTPPSVSVRVAGEVSTSIRPEIIVTSTRNSTIAGTSTSATSVATPTQTEIAQISNEVNLEAVTVKTRDGFSNTNELRTAEKTDNAVNNSVAITESELGALATAVETTTTTATSLLSDVSKLSEEHESSLETNNIGEASPESTTPPAAAEAEAPATVAVATDESTAAAATGGQEIEREGQHHEGQQVVDEQDTEQQLAKTTMPVTTTTTSAATTTTSTTTTTTETPSTTTTMQPVEISLLDDSTTSTTTPAPAPPTRVYFESSTVASTTSSSTTMLPETTTASTQSPSQLPPTFMAPYPNELDHMQTNAQGNGTDVNVIIAITVSVIGVVALVLLVAFLYLMRKRQKQTSYGQRCRPVSLDAYSLDNVSVLGSVRRKGRDVRASKRTYGNAAFDDPSLRHNLLTASELACFAERRSDVFEEFRDVPQIIARADEVPPGCEDKNR